VQLCEAKLGRDRNGKKEGLYPISLSDTVEQKHDWHHHHYRANQQPTYAVDSGFKAGQYPFADNVPG
jgi:hypothetical protein